MESCFQCSYKIYTLNAYYNYYIQNICITKIIILDSVYKIDLLNLVRNVNGYKI